MNVVRRALKSINLDEFSYSDNKVKQSDVENSDHSVNMPYSDDDDDDEHAFYYDDDDDDDDAITAQVNMVDIEEAVEEHMGEPLILNPGYEHPCGPLEVVTVPFQFILQNGMSKLILLVPGVLPDAPLAGLSVGRLLEHTNKRQPCYEGHWLLKDTRIGTTSLRHTAPSCPEDDDEDDDYDATYAAAGHVPLESSDEIVVPLVAPFFDAVLWNAASTVALVDAKPPHIPDTQRRFEWWVRNTHVAAAMLEYAYYHPDPARTTIHIALVRHIGTHYRVPLDLATDIREWVIKRHQVVRLSEDLMLRLHAPDGSELDRTVEDTISGSLTAVFAVPSHCDKQ